jgi:hypothetical protein
MDQTPATPPENTGPLVSEEGQVNLEALSERLGPFNPPAEFDHGNEFDPAPPRPVLRRLRTGSFGRRKWSTVLTLFVLGIGCVIFAPIPFVQKLSFHILPLWYLDWIGYGLIGLAVIIGVANRFSKDRYRSVIEGEPLVGRILGVFTPHRAVLDPQTKNITEFFRYLAAVEFQDPKTGKLERTAVLSEDEWDAKQLPRFDPGVDAGDYVTLVRLPGQGLESVKLYGFLGLDPDRDFITRDGRPLTGVSPYTAVLISVIVLVCLWFLILGIYVLQLCIPKEWSWSAGLPFLGLGAVLGAIGLAWLIWFEQRKQNTLKKSGVVFAALGGAFLGTLAGAVSMGAVNAAFDHSAPAYAPIRIQQHWQTTHNFVFRTYEVEYTPLGSGKSEKHGASVDDLAKLGDAKLGALEVRQGALGLEWIAAVHPVEWQRLEGEPTAEELRDVVEIQLPIAGGDSRSLKMVPHLVVARDEQTQKTAPCPSDLIDAAITEMKGSLAAAGAKVERLQKK